MIPNTEPACNIDDLLFFLHAMSCIERTDLEQTSAGMNMVGGIVAGIVISLLLLVVISVVAIILFVR